MVTLLVYIAGLEFSSPRKEEQLPLPNVEKVSLWAGFYETSRFRNV